MRKRKTLIDKEKKNTFFSFSVQTKKLKDIVQQIFRKYSLFSFEKFT